MTRIILSVFTVVFSSSAFGATQTLCFDSQNGTKTHKTTSVEVYTDLDSVDHSASDIVVDHDVNYTIIPTTETAHQQMEKLNTATNGFHCFTGTLVSEDFDGRSIENRLFALSAYFTEAISSERLIPRMDKVCYIDRCGPEVLTRIDIAKPKAVKNTDIINVVKDAVSSWIWVEDEGYEDSVESFEDMDIVAVYKNEEGVTRAIDVATFVYVNGEFTGTDHSASCRTYLEYNKGEWIDANTECDRHLDWD